MGGNGEWLLVAIDLFERWQKCSKLSGDNCTTWKHQRKWTIYFKWVNFMVCGWYLNINVLKSNKRRKSVGEGRRVKEDEVETGGVQEPGL